MADFWGERVLLFVALVLGVKHWIIKVPILHLSPFSNVIQHEKVAILGGWTLKKECVLRYVNGGGISLRNWPGCRLPVFLVLILILTGSSISCKIHLWSPLYKVDQLYNRSGGLATKGWGIWKFKNLICFPSSNFLLSNLFSSTLPPKIFVSFAKNIQNQMRN